MQDNNPQVTIVIVPRERFSFTKESFESLYRNTEYPFELVYVDNNAPKQVRNYLETQAQQKKFKLLRSDRYLSPNQARNLGLLQVSNQSKYVVFLDNDVVVSPGWLKALVDCAEETEATVVGPVVCQHEPLHTIIHCAGGEYMPAEDLARFLNQEALDNQFRPSIQEKIYLQGKQLADVGKQLQKQPTGLIEFHCMLVRTDLFEQVGLLDEGFCCTKEYIDLAMTVLKAGGTIYLEPASVVTFRTHFPAPPLHLSDIPYFMLRWSDASEKASLRHFVKKWGVAEDEYFQKRYRRLGWRRQIEIIEPVSNRFKFLGKKTAIRIGRILFRLEKLFNFCLTTLHTWKYRHKPLPSFKSEEGNLPTA